MLPDSDDTDSAAVMLPPLPDDDEYVDTDGVSEMLTRLLGTRVSAKTLTNQRAAGRGLKGWKYRGTRPIIKKRLVREYAATDAIQDEHPRQRNARLRKLEQELHQEEEAA
jgi:hypothetical protein